MQELSLHLLDIAQNSIRAQATSIFIGIIEDLKNNTLTITLEDNGTGMSQKYLEMARDPFVTSRTLRKVGLGIPLLNQLCEMCSGNLKLESELGKGTKLIVTMQYDHVDRLPLGNLPSTLTTLILAKPDIYYRYEHIYQDKSFVFDTKEIEEILDGTPINDLEIINWLGNYLQQNINEIRYNNS